MTPSGWQAIAASNAPVRYHVYHRNPGRTSEGGNGKFTYLFTNNRAWKAWRGEGVASGDEQRGNQGP